MSHRQYFLQHGYSPSELYATTYADGGATPFFDNKMSCTSVRQIRDFISAVHEYTQSPIDIVAYSMGTAITRKAILGGHCVDTGETLGRPLTHMIDAYVAVAGVAYGLERCPTNLPACNPVNGMHCESEYLRDVNSKAASYEGNVTYAIFSREDFLVGQECCGHQCSQLKNANLTVIRRHFDHFTIFTQTKDVQLSLIRNHTADAVPPREKGGEVEIGDDEEFNGSKFERGVGMSEADFLAHLRQDIGQD